MPGGYSEVIACLWVTLRSLRPWGLLLGYCVPRGYSEVIACLGVTLRYITWLGVTPRYISSHSGSAQEYLDLTGLRSGILRAWGLRSGIVYYVPGVTIRPGTWKPVFHYMSYYPYAEPIASKTVIDRSLSFVRALLPTMACTPAHRTHIYSRADTKIILI